MAAAACACRPRGQPVRRRARGGQGARRRRGGLRGVRRRQPRPRRLPLFVQADSAAASRGAHGRREQCGETRAALSAQQASAALRPAALLRHRRGREPAREGTRAVPAGAEALCGDDCDGGGDDPHADIFVLARRRVGARGVGVQDWDAVAQGGCRGADGRSLRGPRHDRVSREPHRRGRPVRPGRAGAPAEHVGARRGLCAGS
mmetsp:Transcript_31485/g.68820  ORF Transcript_31485/g.68820 Transcript_31485/m.68820 type:complete len:204 (-) Transcript_31485:952-1563(-)